MFCSRLSSTLRGLRSSRRSEWHREVVELYHGTGDGPKIHLTFAPKQSYFPESNLEQSARSTYRGHDLSIRSFRGLDSESSRFEDVLESRPSKLLLRSVIIKGDSRAVADRAGRERKGGKNCRCEMIRQSVHVMAG